MLCTTGNSWVFSAVVVWYGMVVAFSGARLACSRSDLVSHFIHHLYPALSLKGIHGKPMYHGWTTYCTSHHCISRGFIPFLFHYCLAVVYVIQKSKKTRTKIVFAHLFLCCRTHHSWSFYWSFSFSLPPSPQAGRQAGRQAGSIHSSKSTNKIKKSENQKYEPTN